MIAPKTFWRGHLAEAIVSPARGKRLTFDGTAWHRARRALQRYSTFRGAAKSEADMVGTFNRPSASTCVPAHSR
jgi:hypothetical protein